MCLKKHAFAFEQLHVLVSAGTFLLAVMLSSTFVAWAEVKENAQKDEDKGLVDALKSLFMKGAKHCSSRSMYFKHISIS